MSKRNVLYVVHAGQSNEPNCPAIYETTKQEKAYKFMSDLTKSETNYTKIYLEKRYISEYDMKRNYYED